MLSPIRLPHPLLPHRPLLSLTPLPLIRTAATAAQSPPAMKVTPHPAAVKALPQIKI